MGWVFGIGCAVGGAIVFAAFAACVYRMLLGMFDG